MSIVVLVHLALLLCQFVRFSKTVGVILAKDFSVVGVACLDVQSFALQVLYEEE